MAGQWVDDPSWGGVFNGLFPTSKPGEAMLTAEHIKALQLKRAQDEAEFAAQNAAVGRIAPRYDAMPPPRFLPNPNAGAPYTGGVNDVIANNLPPTTALGDDPFYRAREQARADEVLGTRLAKSSKDIAATRGLGQVYSGGVPTTLPEWQRVQTLLKGEMPTTDPGSTLTQHNYNIYDASGTLVRQGVMQGNIDLQTRQPISAHVPPGGYSRIVQPLAADVKGPVANSEQQLDTLQKAMNEYAIKGTVSNPRDAALALGLQYPQSQKVITDAAGNHFPGPFEGKLIPPALAGLAGHLNATLFGQAAPAAGAPTAPPAMPQTPGAAGVVPTGAPAGTGPAMPPGFQTQAPASQAQTQIAQRVTSASAERLAIEEAIKSGYLPPVSTALINTIVQGSHGAAGFAADQLLKYMDPQGAEYFLNAMRWVEPVIRSASGAAISPREYADYYRMFIPTSGDQPRMVQQKLDAMRRWEQATATGTTTNGVLQLMAAQAQPGTSTASIVERLRVRAQQNGTLAAPNPYVGVGIGTPAGATAAPDAGTVDINEVNRILGR